MPGLVQAKRPPTPFDLEATEREESWRGRLQEGRSRSPSRSPSETARSAGEEEPDFSESADWESVSPAASPASPAAAETEAEAALLAGFRDCAAEAVRYLLEEEGRAADDPAVLGLAEHLQARSACLEYLSLLRRLESELDAEQQLEKLLRSDPEQEQQAPLSPRRRRLVETVFRGCDLVFHQPTASASAPAPAHRLYFHNNDHLDQALSWAHTTDAR